MPLKITNQTIHCDSPLAIPSGKKYASRFRYKIGSIPETGGAHSISLVDTEKGD
ncbi:hypothetical protein [Pontibacter sp. HJ8]